MKNKTHDENVNSYFGNDEEPSAQFSEASTLEFDSTLEFPDFEANINLKNDEKENAKQETEPKRISDEDYKNLLEDYEDEDIYSDKKAEDISNNYKGIDSMEQNRKTMAAVTPRPAVKRNRKPVKQNQKQMGLFPCIVFLAVILSFTISVCIFGYVVNKANIAAINAHVQAIAVDNETTQFKLYTDSLNQLADTLSKTPDVSYWR